MSASSFWGVSCPSTPQPERATCCIGTRGLKAMAGTGQHGLVPPAHTPGSEPRGRTRWCWSSGRRGQGRLPCLGGGKGEAPSGCAMHCARAVEVAASVRLRQQLRRDRPWLRRGSEETCKLPRLSPSGWVLGRAGRRSRRYGRSKPGSERVDGKRVRPDRAFAARSPLTAELDIRAGPLACPQSHTPCLGPPGRLRRGWELCMIWA